MKYLGLYTGQVYEQLDDIPGDRRECAVKLQDDEAADEQYITSRYVIIHTWCKNCSFCSISQQYI